MSKRVTFAPLDPLPSYFVNSQQELISGASFNLQVRIKPTDATVLQVPAGAGDAQVGLVIGGTWRYVSATVERAAIGGAARTLDLFATASADNIVPGSPAPTDSTVYAFALALVEHNANPTGVALYRKIAEVEWNGSIFKSVSLMAGGVPIAGAANPPGIEQSLVQAGVLAGGGLTRNSASSVTVAAGSGYIKDASGLLVPVSWSAATLSVRTPASAALDEIVVDTSGVVSTKQGAVSAGATLANRTGADASGIDAGLLLLHDLNPTSANAGISTTGFRERRRWARGFNFTASPTGSSFNNDVGIVGFRAEVGANPLLITAQGYIGTSTAQNQVSGVQGYIDNLPRPDLWSFHQAYANSGDTGDAGIASLIAPLAAGSHYFGLVAKTPNYIAAIAGQSTFSVTEILRPNQHNGTT